MRDGRRIGRHSFQPLHQEKTMKKRFIIAALAAAGLAQAASAQQLTVVNFGGANGAAQKKAFVDPFEKSGGPKIVSVEYNGEQAKIKAMVETKKVTWDVVEVESPDIARGCEEGLFEKLDYAKVGNRADFLRAGVTECGIGIFVWSTVMAYNGDKLKDGPKNWADFWDTKKFPGKRGMRKGARYNLEFALMADGVPVADVYGVLRTKAGADRAFKKLTELKPHIQWWEAGAQPPQYLVAGDVVMSTVFNGRIDAANREGKNLKITWTGGIYDLDYWAIVKGSPNRDAAYKFIAFASTPEAQAEYAKNIAYGPTNQKALAKLDAKTLDNLPTSPANAKDSMQFGIKFWADQGEELEKRFASWAAQ
jgi:putative spermidine/putrescine transport system substrate-binding protein